jgi:high affinity Mn2+ porin
MNYKARLTASALMLIGYFSGFAGLHAQTTDSSASATDAKDLKPITASSSVPDHINLWNEDEAQNQNWMFHAQNTDIIQGQPGFGSPYQGPNSLTPDDTLRETVSLDFYFGAHIWPGGELYFNPEFYQGYGFKNTHGIANFPNNEAFKLGSTHGNVIIPHLFYRQTFGLGGEQEQISSDSLHLATKEDISRFTITIGKMSVGDLFDDNAYTHDQRTQFLGWTFVDSGAFDFTADSYGYTNGIVLDFNQKNWALRWGGFMVPRKSNIISMDKDFTKAWQDVLELDERYSIGDHPGTVRLLGWLTSSHAGSYYDTVNNPSLEEDITQTAKYRFAYGFALSADQEITRDLGVFTRLSWRDGHSEEWAFTDMDQSVALGAQLKGTAWNRPDDIVGLGDTVGELSRGHATYVNNGGLGPLIGDGHLSYAPENVTETYYDAQIINHVHLAGDFQLVDNPAYNSDRGPVFVFSARLHVEF